MTYKILVRVRTTGMVTRTKQTVIKNNNRRQFRFSERNIKPNKKGFAFLRPDDQEMEDILFRRQKSTVQWMETSY
nr:hypothetical protein [Staphylococcus pseudintermedius]